MDSCRLIILPTCNDIDTFCRNQAKHSKEVDEIGGILKFELGFTDRGKKYIKSTVTIQGIPREDILRSSTGALLTIESNINYITQYGERSGWQQENVLYM